jgi:hypothetical protein
MADVIRYLDAAGDAVRRLIPSSQSRFQALMKARRQFDVVPWDEQAVAEGVLPMGALMLKQDYPTLRAAYASAGDAYPPSTPISGRGLDRAVALYPRGDRPARRHEVMHGIQHAARYDPEVEAAIPWWARNARGASLQDELLARLAQREPGAVLDWPLDKYGVLAKTPSDRLVYGAARPALWTARQFRDHPIAAGAAVGTAGLLGASALLGDD